MIDLLPPKVNVSINVKIRLNILAGVLDELTKICGVSIESTLKKGIVDRDVIENIYVSPIDTAIDEEYYSHYRCTYIKPDEKEGRFIAGAMMEKN